MRVSVKEVEKTIKVRKGKYSARIDEVPDLTAEKNTTFIKKILTGIFIASMESVFFPG
jgi:hypothetical protein